MLEALALTIPLLGGLFAGAVLKGDHEYNRSMKNIFGEEHEFSLFDTPWLAPNPPKEKTK